MKRVIGFSLFCIALGILLSFFLPNRFVEVITIIGLMILGYNLFTAPGKGKC